MRFGAAFWVQRTGWPELREAVLRAEAAGFDDLWIDDHLLSDEGDWRDAKLEGWTTLAAVAAVTERARLGHMVSANTLRNPGLTAKMATTIDHVSGGRRSWASAPAGSSASTRRSGSTSAAGFGERLDRLGEAVPLIRRLLDGETVTHEGRFYRFDDAVCAPRPVQAHLPILIGGSGPKKTLPLVARYADMWNAYGTPDGAGGGRRDPAGGLRGRRAGTSARSSARSTSTSSSAPTAPRRSAAWAGWMAAHLPQDGEDRPRAGGPVEEVAAALARYRDAGFAHPILIFRTPFDLETMDRLPELRAALA